MSPRSSRVLAGKTMPQVATKPTKVRPGGRPAYVPTPEARKMVAALAGTHLTWDDLALALGISKETLGKHFRDELAAGKARLKTVINTKWLEKLNAGEQWAIMFGMRTICGVRDDPAGAGMAMEFSQKDPSGIDQMFKIVFVQSPWRANGGSDE